MADYDTPQTFEGTVKEVTFKYDSEGRPWMLKIYFAIKYPKWDNDEKKNVPDDIDYNAVFWQKRKKDGTPFGLDTEAIYQLLDEGSRVRLTGYAKIRRYKDNDGVFQTAKTLEIMSPDLDLDFLRGVTKQSATTTTAEPSLDDLL